MTNCHGEVECETASDTDTVETRTAEAAISAGTDEARERTSGAIREAIVPGAIAGIVGGAVFGAAMIELGSLETIASLVRSESLVLGFVIHSVIAVAIGVGFGLLVWFQRPGTGETLFWGLAYGAV